MTARADALIQSVEHDQVVFLGDFFDDFGDSPAIVGAVAERVKEYLSKYICLLGNHDQAYAFGKYNQRYLCSGWTPYKNDTVNAILTREDWNKFKLHHWIGDWLLSHAGLDSLYTLSGLGDIERTAEVIRANIDSICESTLENLHTDPKRIPSLLEVGRDRGGNAPKGGITWCDWNSLSMTPYINQLVGHTRGRAVRHREAKSSEAYCIDTHMQNYAVIEDGKVTIC